MYQLTTKALDILTNDKAIRRKVAAKMGVGESAIFVSIKQREGKSIATNYDGMNQLMDETGLRLKDLRVFVEEPTVIMPKIRKPYTRKTNV